ncbi:MAG: hypothetical protein LBC18_10545, partial [Opitutaceae bacterium]|nr:hypothetical protein [Opitutaceae bacterium]
MKTHTCHTCHARLAPGALFALALASAAALAPAPAANAAGFSNTPAAHTPASAASGGATATAGGVYLAAPGAVADPGTVVAESETGALPAATLVGGELVPATPAAAAGAGDGAVAAAVAGTSDDTLPQAAAGTPILRITPATRVVPGMISGSGFFVVSNAGGGTLKWAVEEPAPENTILWARDVSGSSGVNTGTLTFTYDANPAGGSYREGYLSISATHMETGGLHKNYAMLLQVANRSGGGAGALPDLIHCPSGLAAAPDGTLYASSLAGSTIHKITLAGGTGAADTLAGKTGASGHVNATGTA